MSDHDFGDSQLSRLILARQPASEESDRPLEGSRSIAQHDPIDLVTCRVGDASCASAHASTLNRSVLMGRSSAERSLLRLQRQYGNNYVGQVLSRAHAAEAGGEGLSHVERSIAQVRGEGQALDRGVQTQMESSFGADFSGVRIHTDSHADNLNRQLSARAFTTGKDIFFRQGEYSPGASTGRELLAHELSHVVQQNGDGIQRRMTVSQPGDSHEIEADQMARAIMQQEQHSVFNADRQTIEKPEEEEKVQTKLDAATVQRQPEGVQDEEERKKLQTKLDGSELARQADEEEPESLS